MSVPFENFANAQSATDRGTGRDRLEEDVVALFDRFRSPLLRYLLSFGLAIPDGEDVVQEVFLALFQHLQQGRPRANLPGWLFRVAHNLGLKRRQRAHRPQEEFAAGLMAVDPRPNPENQMESSQAQQCVLAVVEALPDQDRRCLALRAEGLRYREIAAVLGLSLGSVSISLTRSVARIARAVER